MLEGYFDETNSHDRGLFPCVAGFLFTTENAKLYCSRWYDEVKPLLPEGAEVFHASECANREGKIWGISIEESDAIFAAMAKLTRETVSYGIVVGVLRNDHRQEMERLQNSIPYIGSPYTLCGLRCAEYAANWLIKNNLPDEINFIFELGDKNQNELAGFFGAVERNKQQKKHYRLGTLGFSPKLLALPLQSADLLVWEWQRAYITATVSVINEREWRTTLSTLTGFPLQAEHLSKMGIFIKVIVNRSHQIRMTESGQ